MSHYFRPEVYIILNIFLERHVPIHKYLKKKILINLNMPNLQYTAHTFDSILYSKSKNGKLIAEVVIFLNILKNFNLKLKKNFKVPNFFHLKKKLLKLRKKKSRSLKSSFE